VLLNYGIITLASTLGSGLAFPITMRVLIIVFCCINLATGFVSSAGMPRILTEIRGGYDATVGTDPSTPLQFFTLPGCTCPYAQR
jgi:hypothetical protein